MKKCTYPMTITESSPFGPRPCYIAIDGEKAPTVQELRIRLEAVRAQKGKEDRP